ncbi:MAG: aminotransferase class III-fold pyridoxal phosphate-dependent enzyme [Anaerolineae bacterium]|nr:aminotransferase class III-fold pyridoxal phosphate-dependent enzyme [Anaerolineae bacterium]
MDTLLTSQHHITTTEDAHTSGAYSKRPLALVRGAGCTVWDADGNAYLDFTSGQGVALLGHAHPAVANAVSAQAHTLITCAEAFYNDRRAELYGQLDAILPDEGWRYFLCNSGAEASEAALKVARLLTGRTRIVAAMRGFHGRTLGALGATFNRDYRQPFEGWLPPVTHIPYNDLAAAEAALTDDVAALMIEAVQGEGGVHVIDPAYLRGLRDLCTQRGVLLICDEVQAGLGRVPMGAAAWRASLGTIPAATHGSTFGGNPLSCAAAVATIGALRALDAPRRAAELGAWFVDQLRALHLPAVREVRGQGLLVGLELRGRVTPVLQALQGLGVLAVPAGKTVLRFLPPLIVTQDELAQVVEATVQALGAQ